MAARRTSSGELSLHTLVVWRCRIPHGFPQAQVFQRESYHQCQFLVWQVLQHLKSLNHFRPQTFPIHGAPLEQFP